MSEIPMIIDGRPVESDRHIEVRNPADLAEVVGRVPDASPDDVDPGRSHRLPRVGGPAGDGARQPPPRRRFGDH
jgi:hypothetical protein